MIEILKSIKFIDVLAFVVVAACFACFFHRGLDNGLVAISSAIVSYYFGSSTGRDKPINNDPK